MSNCEFCHKVLSKEKGEGDHGCLDCHGYIYIINGVHVCFHCIENDNRSLRNENAQFKRAITELTCDIEDIQKQNQEMRIKIANHVEWNEGFQRLEKENKRLKREIEVLRQYGNKDCTAMADEVLDNE
jgi:SMC interacting uncharacterized protein involved in chromosome segregation